jgi:hypothetical protein
MLRPIRSVHLMAVAGVLCAAACGGKSNSQGKGGSGGGLGGFSGAGGVSGAGGSGLPITSCPGSQPYQILSCSGTFGCSFDAGCTCHGCCAAHYVCYNGSFYQDDYNDSCGQGPPCDDGGAGSGGSAGGGIGGAGGGGAGGGGMAISACPTSRPAVGNACVGTFVCEYDDLCRCSICCTTSYRCMNGSIELWGSSDACDQITCDAGAGDDAASSAAVCTPGADQTCNDSPLWSSIHGHCTDAGTCACSDAGTNPDSGHCL